MNRTRSFTHDQRIIVFNALIQWLFGYASPVLLNAGVGLEARLLSNVIRKRAFHIIHGRNVYACEDCNILDVVNRRRTLSMKLFNQALPSVSHILHYLLSSFSHLSKRLIIPHVRTSRRLECCVIYCFAV